MMQFVQTGLGKAERYANPLRKGIRNGRPTMNTKRVGGLDAFLIDAARAITR